MVFEKMGFFKNAIWLHFKIDWFWGFATLYIKTRFWVNGFPKVFVFCSRLPRCSCVRLISVMLNSIRTTRTMMIKQRFIVLYPLSVKSKFNGSFSITSRQTLLLYFMLLTQKCHIKAIWLLVLNPQISTYHVCNLATVWLKSCKLSNQFSDKAHAPNIIRAVWKFLRQPNRQANGLHCSCYNCPSGLHGPSKGVMLLADLPTFVLPKPHRRFWINWVSQNL